MIQGFVQALRIQSKIIFIVVRNLKGLTQVVVMADNPEFETAKNLTLESVIRATGEMKDAPQAPGGSEMHPSKIEVLSKADPELPIPV
ncbi:MAG: aspartate--tRNA(Asn) ligase, partial [Candidatus Zambryskibacteria bacterium]|nr:aspartate--tRNA(Asn) ligase [Candidatus Zambryskibacteria bacterium]